MPELTNISNVSPDNRPHPSSRQTACLFSKDMITAPINEQVYDRLVLFTFCLAGPLIGFALSIKLLGVAIVATLVFAYLTLQNKRYRLPAITYVFLLGVAILVCCIRT